MRTWLIAALMMVSSGAVAQYDDYSLDARGSGKNKFKPKSKSERRRKIESEPYYAAIGEGQTLPEGVVRMRIPYNMVSSTHGYDEDGKKQDIGLELSVVGSALVLEYGATSRLSLQLLAPYVLSNELALDADRFAESDVYKEKVAAFTGGVAAKLQAQGLCASLAACTALIDDGYALPVDTPVTLPTGETLTLKAGVPIKTYAHSLVVGAARPKSGRTGLGDIEVGGLFSIVKRYNFGFSLGLGLRLPTGSFEDVPSAERGTGRGTMDLGVRMNLDVSPVRGVWLSFQNQSEKMLKGTTKKRSSLLDNSELNEADATSDAAVAAGADGSANEQKFERQGLRHLGFLKLGWGLGNMTRSLAPIGIQAQYKYARQAEEFLDGDSTGSPASSAAFLTGASFDGLAYRVPLQVSYDHEVPLSGRNVTLATTVDLITLKLYYKF